MPEFEPIEFVGNPSVEELKAAYVGKDDLKYLSTSYNIPFTSSTTKTHSKAMILARLGETRNDPPTVTPTANTQEVLEIERVKVEATILKLQLQLTERENANVRFEQEEQRLEAKR